MSFRKHRSAGRERPPFIDPAFAEALAGNPNAVKRDRNKFDHKAEQLCRQVQRALNLALCGEFGDDLLIDLYIDRVTPAPGAAHLLVHVAIPHHLSIAEVMTRLQRVTSKLRLEVARAITRKRAPELTFVPARPAEVQP